MVLKSCFLMDESKSRVELPETPRKVRFTIPEYVRPTDSEFRRTPQRGARFKNSRRKRVYPDKNAQAAGSCRNLMNELGRDSGYISRSSTSKTYHNGSARALRMVALSSHLTPASVLNNLGSPSVSRKSPREDSPRTFDASPARKRSRGNQMVGYASMSPVARRLMKATSGSPPTSGGLSPRDRLTGSVYMSPVTHVNGSANGQTGASGHVNGQTGAVVSTPTDGCAHSQTGATLSTPTKLNGSVHNCTSGHVGGQTGISVFTPTKFNGSAHGRTGVHVNGRTRGTKSEKDVSPCTKLAAMTLSSGEVGQSGDRTKDLGDCLNHAATDLNDNAADMQTQPCVPVPVVNKYVETNGYFPKEKEETCLASLSEVDKENSKPAGPLKAPVSRTNPPLCETRNPPSHDFAKPVAKQSPVITAAKSILASPPTPTRPRMTIIETPTKGHTGRVLKHASASVPWPSGPSRSPDDDHFPKPLPKIRRSNKRKRPSRTCSVRERIASRQQTPKLLRADGGVARVGSRLDSHQLFCGFSVHSPGAGDTPPVRTHAQPPAGMPSFDEAMSIGEQKEVAAQCLDFSDKVAQKSEMTNIDSASDTVSDDGSRSDITGDSPLPPPTSSRQDFSQSKTQHESNGATTLNASAPCKTGNSELLPNENASRTTVCIDDDLYLSEPGSSDEPTTPPNKSNKVCESDQKKTTEPTIHVPQVVGSVSHSVMQDDPLVQSEPQKSKPASDTCTVPQVTSLTVSGQVSHKTASTVSQKAIVPQKATLSASPVSEQTLITSFIRVSCKPHPSPVRTGDSASSEFVTPEKTEKPRIAKIDNFSPESESSDVSNISSRTRKSPRISISSQSLSESDIGSNQSPASSDLRSNQSPTGSDIGSNHSPTGSDIESNQSPTSSDLRLNQSPTVSDLGSNQSPSGSDLASIQPVTDSYSGVKKMKKNTRQLRQLKVRAARNTPARKRKKYSVTKKRTKKLYSVGDFVWKDHDGRLEPCLVSKIHTDGTITLTWLNYKDNETSKFWSDGPHSAQSVDSRLSPEEVVKAVQSLSSSQFESLVRLIPASVRHMGPVDRLRAQPIVG
eukprot:316609_1